MDLQESPLGLQALFLGTNCLTILGEGYREMVVAEAAFHILDRPRTVVA